MKYSIKWFRYDLRCADNQSLSEALKYENCFPIYIQDSSFKRPIGSASQVWLYHALQSLNKDLNSQLSFFNGSAVEILESLVKTYNIESVYVEDACEPEDDAQDQLIKKKLAELGCQLIISYQRHLWPLREVAKLDGSFYKVFTPFYKKGCLSLSPPQKPLAAPELGNLNKLTGGIGLDELICLPKKPWVTNTVSFWEISEKGAQKQLKLFLDSGLNGYKKGRNFPCQSHVSRLSPYIHFGQISIRKIYNDVVTKAGGSDVDHFISELAWREFSYYLLHHFPKLGEENFQEKFNSFNWRFDEQHYKAWCFGKTGYPIVDAGMRELYQTGYIHNRPRMIVGSFLVKNLGIHWRYGEQWFWNCLFDADSANNTAGWQWVAGTGADAAPYFRIFNPMLQALKFDPDGSYIKHFVPELKDLPVKYLQEPETAPQYVLDKAGIRLGETYPKPIVNFKQTRQIALDNFSILKNET